MKQQKVEKMNNQVILYELDNQNKDSANFENSQIESIQIQVDFDKQLNNTVRDLFLRQDSKNKVIDVGGNQTTTEFINAINQTKMYNLVDIFIIPISGGHQDVVNAKATYELIQGFGKEVIFCLSRSRHPHNSPRLKFQFRNFFQTFENLRREADSGDDCLQSYIEAVRNGSGCKFHHTASQYAKIGHANLPDSSDPNARQTRST